MKNKIRVAVIGAGLMAHYHLQQMLNQSETTEIAVICETSEKAYSSILPIFSSVNVDPPPNEPDLEKLLKNYGDQLDAAFIITPHAYHYQQTVACLEAGLDILLEKPMVMNAKEANNLIQAQQRTGRLLVVAFPGSLSPQIRWAANKARSGEFGSLLSINAVVWQNWGELTAGTWRQQPEISGGGFLFDTGAHLLNTIVDLAGDPLYEVEAWLDNRGREVETSGVVLGRFKSGVLVTMHACGEAIPSCASEVLVFFERAILKTGVWGERLAIQKVGSSHFYPIKLPKSLGVWEQFLAVRDGQFPNPCPPEIGLRMALLYDAICASAQTGGNPVMIG